MSQLSQIRTAVQGNWPSNYHSATLTDTKTDEFINAVQRWICQGTIITPDFRMVNHSFDWMKREVTAYTVDSQQRYNLPAATSLVWRYKEEISCELVNSENSRILLTRELKRNIEVRPDYVGTADIGTPSRYAIDQGAIWLYPIPDHTQNAGSAWTINFEYYGYLPDLSGNTDTNELTNNYPEILEFGATEAGFRYGQDYEQANYFKGLKTEKFIEMLREDQARVLSNLETGMEPMQGSGFADNDSGNGYYYNDTPYA